MAKEIKRIKIAYGLQWDDFAILLRFNAQSRGFEKAMQVEGIPNRILGGHKVCFSFFFSCFVITRMKLMIEPSNLVLPKS